jgi:signal transduction histidine kinase
MSSFGWGLVMGLLGSGVVAAGAGAWAYRRFILLERRTRDAERLAELGTLTGGLAHEIKNPLSTVQLNLQLLQEDLDRRNPGYARIIRRLETVQRETGRLKDILDDFLRYAGKLELDRRPVDLVDLLDELVDFFAPQAQLSRVQARVRPADGPVIASVDPKLIKQTVLNLMLNAVQAMGEKGGELILSASQQDGEARIDVIDTGPGIPPEALEQVFQAYYSTKSGGTGLGLAMAKRIAEEHGGRISVHSEVGKGTDFAIHLPAAKEGVEIQNPKSKIQTKSEIRSPKSESNPNSQ